MSDEDQNHLSKERAADQEFDVSLMSFFPPAKVRRSCPYFVTQADDRPTTDNKNKEKDDNDESCTGCFFKSHSLNRNTTFEVVSETAIT